MMGNPFAYLLTIPGVAAVIAAAANAPPDLTGIAALITALIGVIGFLATLIRGKKNNQRVEEVEQAASYVKGFESLINRLKLEMEEVKKEQSEERSKWRKEREDMLDTIRVLRTELREMMAEQAVTKGQLELLRGQIRGFLSTKDYEEFQKHIS